MEGKLLLQKQLYVELCMYLCAYVFLFWGLFFSNCLVLNALRTILGSKENVWLFFF